MFIAIDDDNNLNSTLENANLLTKEGKGKNTKT